MPKITPMRLLRVPAPLSNPDLTWEIKLDGFRALAFIENGRCTFVSRNGHTFKSWPSLCEQMVKTVRCRSAILDEEVVCLDADGRANFRNLLFRRQAPHFVPFDLLACDGEDVTQLPLIERKARLRRMVRGSGPVMFLDGIRGRGPDLFREACRRDIEGIVGKHVAGTRDPSAISWNTLRDALAGAKRQPSNSCSPRGCHGSGVAMRRRFVTRANAFSRTAA